MKYDITGDVGPLYPIKTGGKIPMYSYERPADILWDAIYNGLRERDWTHEEAVEWLQSKAGRWALNGDLGEAIRNLGLEYANTIFKKSR